jgi:hypothetical protein
MDDPLARFKREQLAHAILDKEEQNIKAGIQKYQAFAVIGKADKSNSLQIRCAQGLTHSVNYSHLLDVCYDGIHGTELILLFSFMQVKIKGKHLQPVIAAVESRECVYLQDYDAHSFTEPRPNEAVIDSIEVIAGDLAR